MQSCLGLYIENNLIKYAKVSKEKNNYRIESFGLKFYDDIEETIKKIISETYSYKTPIVVNLSEEEYTYANLFSLLNKNDLEKAVNTEFDYFCNEAGKNKKAIEFRRLLVPNLEDKDRIVSLYAYTDRSEIVRKLQILDSYVVKNVVPEPIAIANLIPLATKKNCIIVNIEKKTSFTTVVNGQVQRVDTVDYGTKDILDGIMLKENSYDKAYEICKDTTIYTSQGKNLQIEENEYLEDIMPTLYKIVEKLKETIENNNMDVSSIYITGLAAVINNIDLYFQENFPSMECEILTPFFIKKTNVKLNIKDYIEVNSAVALALQGVGLGFKEMNFRKSQKSEQWSKLLNVNIGKSGKQQKEAKSFQDFSFKSFFEGLKHMLNGEVDSVPLDAIEKGLIRAAVAMLIVFLMYTFTSKTLINKINKKSQETQENTKQTQMKIAELSEQQKKVNDRTSQYKSLIEKIDAANNKKTESFARKDAIPNLLTRIMYNIPKEVQLISVENPSGKTIKIEAQSSEYEELGYFVAKLKTEGILSNVTQSAGIKKDEFVRVTIQGDLPY